MILPVPDNTIVLTVNLRLARWLRIQDSSLRKESGQTLWETPAILPISSWLNERWEASWPETFPLSEIQVRTVWENLLLQDDEFQKLDPLHIHGAAKQASQAYALVHQYRIPRNRSDLFDVTEETRHFYRWMQSYEKWLVNHDAFDPCAILDAVKTGMGNGKIPLPSNMVIAGLDDVSPQLNEFLEFLSSKNCVISYYPHNPSLNPSQLKSKLEDKNITVQSFQDRKQEARQCARWVRKVFSSKKSIGVVALDLENYRTLLPREFSAELAPESVLPGSKASLPFDISLGPSLADEALVLSALTLLKSWKAPFTLNAFISIIQSPYFLHSGENKEFSLGLVSSLKKKKYLSVEFNQAKRFIPKRQAKKLIQFLRSWEHFARGSKRQTPGKWSSCFSEFLREVGWPARHRTLNSREHQSLQAWNTCLDAFASLDTVTSSLTRKEAVQLLTRMVEEQAFQEKTEERSIEILGSLEAAGQKFDALWVLGCHGEAFPAAPGPNPFIPIGLQKALAIPHSSPTRELIFAQTVLKRLVDSSPEIIFSYPAMEGEQELIASPLLKLFQQEDETRVDISNSNRLRDHLPFNIIKTLQHEEPAIPVSKEERGKLSGGYRILKNQADCPFRAFATHRLFADRVQNPEIDFDPVDRGNLVHRALELFWINIKSLEDLNSLCANKQLEHAIEQAVSTAFNEKDFADKWKGQEQFRQLEHQRIRNILQQWMTEEQKRSSFKVVEQEKKERVEIEGLKLQLRIDRIDEMENGDRLLIDYKTGNVKPQQWFGERIRDPQLPLYASKLQPRAIAFAQIKKGSLELKGVSDSDLLQRGMTLVNYSKNTDCENWDQLMDHWNQVLSQTMHQFLDGWHTIDPIDGDTTCRYCSMGTLCRIEELKVRASDEEQP